MKRLLLAAARTRAGGLALRVLLERAPALLPVARLADTPAVLAFRHPAPAYPVHILILPRPLAPGLGALQDGRPFVEAVRAAHRIAQQLRLPPGWRLVANSGRFQDVGVLHFHLVGESPAGCTNGLSGNAPET